MKRVVEPELLDELPANDPRAVGSRKDLRRLNAIMGHAGILKKFLDGKGKRGMRLMEIGAGDGNIGFRLARHFSERGIGGKLLLLDRQAVVSAGEVAPEGWEYEVRKADVFEGMGGEVDVMVANLFLHHFEDEKLRRLFEMVARSTLVFAAAEPRRSSLAIGAAKMIWAVGCNEVTRHDAVISVKAGFCGKELSKLWPFGGWRVEERSAGLFSHFFGAVRE